MKKMIGKKVELCHTEKVICTAIAKKRLENCSVDTVENKKISDKSDFHLDLEGFGAEMAFCKLFGTYPDFTVHPRNTSSDRGDTSYMGKSIDIKSTTYKTGRLLAGKWKSENVDIYALMVGSFPSYEFRGFMAQGDLLNKKRLGKLKGVETYLAEQKDLKEWDEL